MRRELAFLFLLSAALFGGCTPPAENAQNPTKSANEEGEVASATAGDVAATETLSPADFPVFVEEASEYPSWSTQIVAGKAGLINPAEGGVMGPLEKKWQVDIVLSLKDYDSCLTSYSSGTCDAVCVTNIDSLNACKSRPGTAIMPTSTSVGGDKVIAIGMTSAEDLKGKKVYGLANSVSQYVFYRGLEKKGIDPSTVEFANLDPGPAATAMQTGSSEITAICVWNPYALQTVRSVKGAEVLFDSSIIPEEVIDQIVVANESLQKPGGDRFACLICDIQYSICEKILDSKTQDVTLKALAEDFAKDLTVDDMKVVIKDTSFYNTPSEGVALFEGDSLKTNMTTVLATCEKIGIMTEPVTVGYEDSNAQLNFTTKYMKQVLDAPPAP